MPAHHNASAAAMRVRPNALKYNWAKHRNTITALYETKGYHQMARELEKLGFAPSRRAYFNKLKQWGVEKNMPSANMKFMAEKAAKRKAEDGGKETVFAWQGRRVPAQRIERFRRQRVVHGDGAAAAEAGDAPTPKGVSYRTPSPPVMEAPISSSYELARTKILDAAPTRRPPSTTESQEDYESSIAGTVDLTGERDAPVPYVGPEKAEPQLEGLAGDMFGDQQDNCVQVPWLPISSSMPCSQSSAFPSPLPLASISPYALVDRDPERVVWECSPQLPCYPWSHTADPQSMLAECNSFFDIGPDDDRSKPTENMLARLLEHDDIWERSEHFDPIVYQLTCVTQALFIGGAVQEYGGVGCIVLEG